MSRLGIEGFEHLVPEGLPKAAAVLILVPPAEEKDQVAAQFVLEGLRNGDAAIVLESEVGIRDLARRLGNLGLDVNAATSQGKFSPLEWATAAAARQGAPAGLLAVQAALAQAALAAKKFPGLRVLVDLAGALPESLASSNAQELTAAIGEFSKGLGALSLALAPRAQGATPPLVEAFELVLDLRPLKPTGFGLAVIAIGGTPLPRSPAVVESVEGRLVLAAARKPVAALMTSIECPVCKSTIPAGLAECPVCKSPRPVRRPGEPEVLDYIEALGQRVGPREAAPPEALPPPPPPPPMPPPLGKEAAPARPEPPRRGLTNGLAQRRKVASPAAPKGRVNGQGRTNGLTSSIASTRRGMTNGLTNGNGFTNGLGARRFAAESRQRAWRVWVIPVLAAALLSVPLLFSVELVNENRFGIDGSFGDWPTRASLAPDPALPGSVDLTGAAVRMDPDRLYGFVETREALFAGSPDGVQTDAVRMFVDSDGAAATGYAADGLGADLLVQVTGARGSVAGASVSTFDPAADPSDWGGWVAVDTALVAVGRGAESNRVEFALAHFPGRNGSTLRASFETLSFDGAEDSSGFALGPVPDTGTLVVEQRSLAPLAIANGSSSFLEVNVRAPVAVPSGAPALASLGVTATGSLPVTALLSATLLDAAGATLASASRNQNGFNFVLSPPLAVPQSGVTLTVAAVVDVASQGDTVGLEIASDADVHAMNAIVSLATLPADRDLSYAGGAPPGVAIDGAFGDWPAPAADGVGEASTQGNRDIDLSAYDSVRAGSTVAVYAGVVGRILHGSLVPARNPEVPRAPPADADRDGVPDAVDPYPNDFNNDGTPDASTPCDVDGDSVPDFGCTGGTDEYLNTTIPGSYPPPYAGRFVSVYIGPVQRPAVTRGEDTLRVFIDSDANPATGYATTVGADWMVEVVGRHGVPRTQTLSRFTGPTPGVWSWAPAGTLEFAAGTRQLELRATLTAAPVPGTQVVVDLLDWRGGTDMSGVATRGSTRSGDSTSIDAGAYTALLAADLTAADGVLVSTDRFSARWSLAGVLLAGASGGTSLAVGSHGLEASETFAAYALDVGGVPASMRYAFGPGAVHEDLVLSSPLVGIGGADAVRVRFSLTLSGAVLLPLSGSPVTRDLGGGADYAIIVDGEVAARFTAPFLTDAAGVSTACAFETPGPAILDVVCPTSALLAARYPVSIDPSTTFTLSNNGPNGQAGETMGWSVAAGDFNGDGYLDVLTGAPLNDKDASDAGIAYIYLGPFTANTSSPSVNLKGNGTTLYRAGYGVAAGDFNNDGYDDAVVGQQNGGPALVFYGRSAWPGTVSTANVTFPVPSPVSAESFGRVFAVGNFDGSSGADLVIGRPFFPSATTPNGRGYLFFSPFSSYEPTADLLLAPFNDTKGRFGWSMATGKIDSDTKDDLIVGEITVTSGANTFGRISLFKGSSLTGSGTKTPDTVIFHTTVGSQFGSSVAVGKLNGDAYADVMVGAPALSGSNGAAYLFLAKADGTGLNPNQTATVTLSNQASGEKFGSSSLILDYFGDGTGDAVAGAEAYNSNQGRVYVFNNPLSDQTVDETLTGQGSGATPEQFGHVLAGGKKASDTRFVLVVGGPYWDDTGETDAGRVVVATLIPEFSDAIAVAGLSLFLIVLVRRRGRRA